MRSNRIRRQQKARVENKVQPSNTVPASSDVNEKMVEEIPVEDQQMKLRKFFTADEEGMVKVDQDLIHAIRERYQELLKELWENQGHLDDFNFSEDEKDILNKRVKLWLEYFISTATFRDENVNLFEYMDSFCDTQKFI